MESQSPPFVYCVDVEAWNLDNDNRVFSETVEYYTRLELANASARHCALFGSRQTGYVAPRAYLDAREKEVGRLQADEDYCVADRFRITRVKREFADDGCLRYTVWLGPPSETGESDNNTFRMRPKQVVATVRKLRILDSDNAMSSATLKNWDRFMSPEQSHRPRTLKRAHSETSQSSEADFPTETEERAHKRRILAGPSEAKPLVSEGSTELSALQRERSSSLSSTSTIAVSPSSSPPPVSDPATCLQPLEMSTQQLKQAFQIISLSATISIDRMSAREEELRKKDVYLEERNKRQQKREVDMKKDYEKLRAWKHSLTEKYKKEGQSLEKQWKDLQEEKRNTDEIKRRSEELDKEKDAFEAVRQEHNMKHENAMKYWGERNDQLTSEREEFEKEKLAMEKEKEDRLVELEKEKLAMQKDKEDRLVEIQKEMQHMMAKYLTGN